MPHDARPPHHDTDPPIPADLASIAEALDRLAMSDRAEPSDGFEQRIAQTTFGRDSTTQHHAPFPLSLWSIARWALPIAACLAVFAGVVWTAGPGARNAPVGPSAQSGTDAPTITLASVSIETEIDDLLFIDALGDDPIAPDGSSVDSLYWSDDEPAGDLFLDTFGVGTPDSPVEGETS